MAFDIICFGEAAPGANGTLAGNLGDTHYFVSGDDIIIKDKAPYLLGVFAAMESTGEQINITQPSLPLDYNIRKIGLLNLQSPALGWTHLWGRPLPLVGGEKVNIETQNATDEDAIVALMVGNGKITQNMLDAVNPTHIISGEADTTATAFTWSALTVTWQQDLPAGRYAVVGMRYGYWKTAAPAMPSIARLSFPETKAWRPGVPGIYQDKDHEEMQTADVLPFTMWPLMSECSFPHTQMPAVEVFSAEAHTDENIELLLQKIA